ncbi:melanocortin receptor 5-like [Haliotis rufescens]|uniref:melanocortin receptor 5-like n=1 Tax=Haliotis rufescens TaxID=6454 RepID=UPI00201EC400|nr:melanocortin receptor 5-like [Haliotis rufescens]
MANNTVSSAALILFTTLNGHGVTATSLAVNGVILVIGILALSSNAFVLDTLVKRTSLEATDLVMCHLAVTDMLTGLLVIHNVVHHIAFFVNSAECLIRLGGTFIFLCGSVYHLTLLTLDRFVQIVYPYRYQDVITRKTVSIMSAAIWVFSVNLGLLPVYGWRKVPKPSEPPCSLFTVLSNEFIIFGLVTFYIPVGVIVTMYTRIYLVARRHTRAIAATEVNSKSETRNSLKFAKTVMFLIGAYLVTILPLALVVTIYMSGGSAMMTPTSANNFVIYTSVMTYCNSVINPVIYAFKLPPVRKRFLALCCRRAASGGAEHTA